MIGFVLFILVIGALLTVIFGKHVGAMFVKGTATIIAVIIIIFLLMISPMIWSFFTAPSKTSSSDSSYSPSSQPTYQPAYSAPAQPLYATPAQPAVSPELAPPVPGGPTIGIAISALPYAAQKRLLIAPNYGLYITGVVPGGPADRAGLQINDVVLSADGQLIEGSNPLSACEAKKGAGQPITLEAFRATPNGKILHWYPVVTPQ